MIRSLAESFALKGIQSIHNFSLKTAELNEKYMNDQRIGKKTVFQEVMTDVCGLSCQKKRINVKKGWQHISVNEISL